MLVSGHAGSDPQSLIHYLLSKASRTPGRNGNSRRGAACCGPPEGVRPARLCESQEQSIHSPPMTIRFGLRAPGVGRRPSAHARRFYEPQKHGPKHNQKLAPNLSGSACRPLPRAASPLGEQAGDPKGSQEFSPIHRLNFARFAASGDCNELRQVAVRRVGWRRTARLSESQKLDSKHSLIHHPNLSPLLGPARLENRLRFSSPKTGTTQSSHQFSASCRPHCGSALAPPRFRAPGEILSKRASTF